MAYKRKLITIVQQGTGKELEEKQVHDLFNNGIEEGDMYYDATHEFQKRIRQINYSFNLSNMNTKAAIKKCFIWDGCFFITKNEMAVMLD